MSSRPCTRLAFPSVTRFRLRISCTLILSLLFRSQSTSPVGAGHAVPRTIISLYSPLQSVSMIPVLGFLLFGVFQRRLL